MTKLLVLVHTISPSLATFDSRCDELLPGVKRMHILDEPLLECIRKRGHLAPQDSERMHAHLAIAEQIGADAVLVTCSSVSPCVDDVCSEIAIPVVRIDDAMIEQALIMGTRISVVATSETTLEPTRQRLQAEADRLGRQIQVELGLAVNALPALIAGDSATHDRLVRKAVLEKMEHADLIVLAQASMDRVLQAIPEAERRVPVLSSPRLAIDRVARVLEQA